MAESKVKNSPAAKAIGDKQKSKVSKKETKKPAVKIAKKTVKLEAAVPVEAKVKSRATKNKAVSLKADVYDSKGKIVESINLPEGVFGAKINDKLMAQAVRVYLANQRAGTASTKTRGEVKGSSRKIYKQKGTGRARHGSIRAPIFVHGGIVFGPKPRDYSLKLPPKMKKAALFSALSAKLKDGEIKIISGLEKISPKTKKMVEVIENLDLGGKSKVLLVLPQKSENINRAARNIERVGMILANQLNTYEVLNTGTLLLMRESIEELSKNLRTKGLK